MGLALAIGCALAFTLTNGFLDASSTVATLIATRAAAPGPAIAVSAAFNLIGALVMGTAVASTISGIVTVRPAEMVHVLGAALLAATAWNILMWRARLPSSSGHALLGGLIGSGLATAGASAVRWGGLRGVHPEGVAGVLVFLAVAPLLSFALAAVIVRLQRWMMRRASVRMLTPVRGAQWTMSSALALSHGANDAEKSMGAITALLLAAGDVHAFAVPVWVKFACGGALALGTSMGGWRVVRTVGAGIFRMASLDGLSSETAATAVILSLSLAGAPIASSQVVASSVVGVGAGERRLAHVRWDVVSAMGFAWLVTVPAACLLGALLEVVWRALA
jgi:PiT family inorganic phosphate transporter